MKDLSISENTQTCKNCSSFSNRDVLVQKGVNNSQGAPVKLAGQGKEPGAPLPPIGLSDSLELQGGKMGGFNQKHGAEEVWGKRK